MSLKDAFETGIETGIEAGTGTMGKGQYKAVQMHDYHKLGSELEDYINQLEMYHEIISPEQLKRLRNIVQESEGVVSLNVNEVDRQYILLLKMQKKVVDDEGNLLDAAGLKELSTVVSSMGSVISLYMKARKDINIMKGEANLKAAVLAAVKTLPEANRSEFFKTLEGYSKD